MLEQRRPVQILLIFFRRDERFCSSLFRLFAQSSDIAFRISMMVAEHPPARQRHMPPLQVIPKGFGISNPKKGTGPYFTEVARNLLSTGQPESMQACLGIKNGEIVRILSFYVRALRLARNNEKICTAASRDRLPQNARREKPFVSKLDGTVQHENVEFADKLKVLKAVIQKKDVDRLL